MNEVKPMTTPATVVWLFANQDEKLALELIRFSSGLEREGLIKNWWPDKILPGMPWRQELERQLGAAQVIILLASPDLFADDRELWLQGFRLAREHGRRLITLHLRHAILPLELSGYQALPRTGQPLAARKNRDEAILEIVHELRGLIQYQSEVSVSPGPDRTTRSPLPISYGHAPVKAEAVSSPGGPSGKEATPKQRTVLHLSDLYFSKQENNAFLSYSQLSLDLQSQNVTQLDAVVLSGNIAQTADPQDYEVAAEFLGRLMERYKVPKQHLIIVPGATDVNMQASQAAYRVIRASELPRDLHTDAYFVSGNHAEVLNPELYPNRFKAFSDFYRQMTGRDFNDNVKHQYVAIELPDLGVSMLGLNSAWQLDHLFPHRIAINVEALHRGLDQMREKVKIAVFHHPLDHEEGSRVRNRAFIETLAVANFRLILHGHRHQTSAQEYRYDQTADGRRLSIVGGGTFGAASGAWTPGFARQYNLLSFESDKLHVRSRRQQDPSGHWDSDPRWRMGPRQDPSSKFTIEL